MGLEDMPITAGYTLMGLTVVDNATGVTLSRRTPAD